MIERPEINEEEDTFIPDESRPSAQTGMLTMNEFGDAISDDENNEEHSSHTITNDDINNSYNLPSTAPAMRLIRAVCRSTLRRLETFHTRIGTTTQKAAEYYHATLQQQMEEYQIIPEDLEKHDISTELPKDYTPPTPLPQTTVAFGGFTQPEERERRLENRRETPQKTLQRLHREPPPPIEIPDIPLILEEPYQTQHDELILALEKSKIADLTDDNLYDTILPQDPTRRKVIDYIKQVTQRYSSRTKNFFTAALHMFYVEKCAQKQQWLNRFFGTLCPHAPYLWMKAETRPYDGADTEYFNYIQQMTYLRQRQTCSSTTSR